jgi:hypothetical protein
VYIRDGRRNLCSLDRIIFRRNQSRG